MPKNRLVRFVVFHIPLFIAIAVLLALWLDMEPTRLIREEAGDFLWFGGGFTAAAIFVLLQVMVYRWLLRRHGKDKKKK